MRHLLIIFALLCVSCNARLPSIKPYKMDIQQGNVVTSKMMLQLKPGMTKSQVRFIMGTPLIQDGFHPNRWDYFYQMRKDGKIIEQRRVIMEFDNDALVRIRGDVIPAGSEQTVEQEKPATPTKIKPKKQEEKKSLWERLQFWKDDEEPDQPQAVPEKLVTPAAMQENGSGSKPPAVATPPAKPVEPAAVTPERSPSTATSDQLPEDSSETDQNQSEQEPVVEPASAPKAEPADSASSPKESSSQPEAEPKSAPEPASAAEPKPGPAAEPQPARKARPMPEEIPEPEPEDDLPPEDAPGYFEKMLEKIGF